MGRRICIKDRKDISKFVGEIILENRLEKNLTQRELSEKIGISPEEISQYEGGLRLPTLIIFLNIISVFKFNLKIIYEIVDFCKIKKNKSKKKNESSSQKFIQKYIKKTARI